MKTLENYLLCLPPTWQFESVKDLIVFFQKLQCIGVEDGVNEVIRKSKCSTKQYGYNRRINNACMEVSVSSLVTQDVVIEVRGHRLTSVSPHPWRSAQKIQFLLPDISQRDHGIHSPNLSDYSFVCTKLPPIKKVSVNLYFSSVCGTSMSLERTLYCRGWESFLNVLRKGFSPPGGLGFGLAVVEG